MKVRLFLRLGIADYDGKLAGYDYKTCIADIDETIFNDSKNLPEIIGGEWLKEEEK
jgi:hypothetical protein